MGRAIQIMFALYWAWRYGREERREQRARTQHNE